MQRGLYDIFAKHCGHGRCNVKCQFMWQTMKFRSVEFTAVYTIQRLIDKLKILQYRCFEQTKKLKDNLGYVFVSDL